MSYYFSEEGNIYYRLQMTSKRTQGSNWLKIAISFITVVFKQIKSKYLS